MCSYGYDVIHQLKLVDVLLLPVAWFLHELFTDEEPWNLSKRSGNTDGLGSCNFVLAIN